MFLPFAKAFLVWRILEGPRAAAVVTTVLVLPSIVLANIVFFNLFGDFTRYGFAGFLFWANLLLLIASYVQLLPPALRRFDESRREPLRARSSSGSHRP